MSGARNQENGIDLADTRRRASRIDHYLDMIPARFYLGTETAQATIDSRASLDPARAKATSILIMEAAAAQEGKSGASGSSSKRPEKRKKPSVSPAADRTQAAPNSRGDLHEKLQRRIAELKEERKRRQSEQDKARAAEIRQNREQGGSGAAPNSGSPSIKPKRAPVEADSDDDEDGPEAGRVSFDTSTSNLPFEAGIGRKGRKVKKLRAELRKSEADATKLREAESRGEGEAVRKEQAIKKALQRARGEKVHDDVSKLRKAQKQMDMKKKKGKDKWEAKVATDKQKADDMQQQRKDNLKNRGSKKKKKRAGFEGKKTSYLNTD
eukprot:TRINITY_DN97705_c0_g1_i1.p1 TRINITY_DN97705_c0_g1~~TRINITY_DN97705_c0_g1_i1.p1  ORF type:complete len:355 (-),score=110.64 TRINITY_DN97705_c0_g1_i1:129-1100(-)